MVMPLYHKLIFFTPFVKLVAPHVRVWDSVSLNTLHVIGSGVFDRAVTCVAFSKSVCWIYKIFPYWEKWKMCTDRMWSVICL